MTDEQKYESLQKFIAKWKPGMPWRYRSWNENDWLAETNGAEPSMLWRSFECDLLPDPVIEPWTFEEAPLTLKVRLKSNGTVFSGHLFGGKYNIYPEGGYAIAVDRAELARDFEQLDGQPCGKVVQP